jgi:hypothetical protein
MRMKERRQAVQRQIQQQAGRTLALKNWSRNVVAAAPTRAGQLCSQFLRSAGGDGQVMKLLLFENRECSISRKAYRQAAPWLRCQHCGSAVERNSPASSPRSVFGVMQDTAVAGQSDTTGGMAMTVSAFSAPRSGGLLSPPSAPNYLAADCRSMHQRCDAGEHVLARPAANRLCADWVPSKYPRCRYWSAPWPVLERPFGLAGQA